MCAYLAAVFLTAEARRRDDADLETWFRRRARSPAGVPGRSRWPASPSCTPTPTGCSTGCSAGALLRWLCRWWRGSPPWCCCAVGRPGWCRTLAGLAVAALVVGWGTAQYPVLLGTHASLDEAAAPEPSLVALTVVFVIAGLLVVPSLALLYVLAQRGHLEG